MLVYWPGWFCESGDREVAAGHGGVQRVDEWGGLPHRGWGMDCTSVTPWLLSCLCNNSIQTRLL